MPRPDSLDRDPHDGRTPPSDLPSSSPRLRARRAVAKVFAPAAVGPLAIALSSSLLASSSFAGRTYDFKFHDDEYLYASQQSGGRAYVPTQVRADEPVPLVVFLHGVNRYNQLHMWLGPGPDDLRAQLDGSIRRGDLPPAIIAAPSQTKSALWASQMWIGIDLDEFVTATERAIRGRARIARDHVIVAGHSGAGCTVEGGLLKIAADRGAIEPIGIVALDTCLSADVGEALARASESTRIATYWQSIVWNRRFADFAIGFAQNRAESAPGNDWFEHVDPVGRWPHDALVVPSLLQAISVLLGPPQTTPTAPDMVAEEGSAAFDGPELAQ